MKSFLIKPISYIRGEIVAPPDKSISHRVVFISSIAKGKNVVENFSLSKDCLYTLEAFQRLGIRITRNQKRLTIYGKGLYGLRKPPTFLFVGDSGTTIRLLCGVLSGQKFSTTLKAGSSLSHRPMRRVLEPLRMMGACIESLNKDKDEEYPPLVISGRRLFGIDYTLPIPSAQVKSSILLAGLLAEGVTSIREPIKTRDHTERLLRLYGADISLKNQKIYLKPSRLLKSPGYIFIPGDISSISFFLVAVLLLKNSYLIIRDVGLNPTRMGLLKVLRRMGADIQLNYKIPDRDFQEPLGDILVRSSSLKPTYVRKEEIPSLIDELPILMVASCLAKGRTIIESVEELRVKETDRINSMVAGLSRMGAEIYVEKKNKTENLVIEGIDSFKPAELCSFGDHRTAMSLVVAGLLAKGESSLDDISCVDKSFPDFLKILKKIAH